jgi:hypothetical protein
VQGIEGRVIVADVVLDPGSAGGPVFTREGRLVGISSIPGEDEDGAAGESRVIRVEEVCAAVAAAEPAMKDAAAPDAAPLPVEPARPFPIAPPAAPAAPALDAHRLSSSDYDVTFITPVLLQAARQPAARDRAGAGRVPDPREIDPLDDFANWRTYVRDEAAVLMIRVTPKLTEGFWTKVARGAAQTQGVSLPPIKRFKPGFARLQAFCGEAEVTPIHPFKLVQRVSETEAIYEGLYVFDPDALGPPCGTVRLVLYSEKAPQQGETRVVEAKVLRRIWDDFAPYRAGR